MRLALNRRRGSLVPLLAAGALVAVGLALYVPLVPLFQTQSDRLALDWLRGHSLAAPWWTAAPAIGYRPLTFTLWRLLALLPGEAGALAVRALTLGLHVGNALLILALVARKQGRRGLLVGVGTALLFLLFPLGYSALWATSSLGLTLGTALILGALYLGSSAATPWRGRGILSLLLALAACLAHETGALVAPLLLLLLATGDPGLPRRELVRRAMPYWPLAVAGLALQWGFAPASPPPRPWQMADLLCQGLAGWVPPLASALGQQISATGGLQALAIGVLPAIVVVASLRVPMRPWKVGVLAIIWLAFWQVPNWAVVLLAAWPVLLWAAGRGRLVGLALGWVALWLMSPLLLPRTAAGGTSLLYGASIGAALFWAIPLGLEGRPKAAILLPGAVLVLALAAGGYAKLRGRHPVAVGFHRQVGLLAATCERGAEGVQVILEWQCWQPVDPDIAASVHLCDAAGRAVAQADGDPLGGTAPFSTWRPGDEFAEIRLLRLPSGLPRGRFTVRVGLYDRQTGARLPAAGPGGGEFPTGEVPVAAMVLP